MRASKALTVSLAAELPASPWRVTRVEPTTTGWSLKRLFTRKPPSLFQRCLAVHIYHTSRQTSLH